VSAKQLPDRAASATFFEEQQMDTFLMIRDLPVAVAIAALALVSGAALSGENEKQAFGRSSVHATAPTSGAPTNSAVAALRDGRSSVYVSDIRDAPREVHIASRSPGFRSNGRGSVYAWQIRQPREGVASLEHPRSGNR
jgi:hypothetical protein